ncbi:MAG: DivIVA domain-containing protein [Thermoleophilaceae bacterium]
MAQEPFTGPDEPRPPRRQRKRSAADGIRAKEFPPAMRGYDRAAVDSWRDEMVELVERLEEQLPRDAAVKRALEEVGQETAAILQRAHEAADEIASRSRSQAEGRLQRAEREAETTVSEAEARVGELDASYRSVWEERQRLLEEMRQLADDVLGVADDASERLDGPQDRDPVTSETGESEASDEPTEETPVVDGEAPVLDTSPASASPVTPEPPGSASQPRSGSGPRGGPAERH